MGLRMVAVLFVKVGEWDLGRLRYSSMLVPADITPRDPDFQRGIDPYL